MRTCFVLCPTSAALVRYKGPVLQLGTCSSPFNRWIISPLHIGTRGDNQFPQGYVTSHSERKEFERTREMYRRERELIFGTSEPQEPEVIIAGVDEVGIGSLAGPVVAAAVVLDRLETNWIKGLKDSKRLSSSKRSALFEEMKKAKNVYMGIGIVESELVDSMNVLKASLYAMKRAVVDLKTRIKPDYLLIDGRNKIETNTAQHTVIKGDRLMASIAAASIVAKVTRDEVMVKIDRRWPEYGFAKHKGYPTVHHRRALSKYGVCPIHRTCFKPVLKAITSVVAPD